MTMYLKCGVCHKSRIKDMEKCGDQSCPVPDYAKRSGRIGRELPPPATHKKSAGNCEHNRTVDAASPTSAEDHTEADAKALSLAENHLFSEDADELEDEEVNDICWALVRKSRPSPSPVARGEWPKGVIELARTVVNDIRNIVSYGSHVSYLGRVAGEKRVLEAFTKYGGTVWTAQQLTDAEVEADAIFGALRPPSPPIVVSVCRMDESNGCTTWIVQLAREGGHPLDGFQVYASHSEGRARYTAEEYKHFFGQAPKPDILAFDDEVPPPPAVVEKPTPHPNADYVCATCGAQWFEGIQQDCGHRKNELAYFKPSPCKAVLVTPTAEPPATVDDEDSVATRIFEICNHLGKIEPGTTHQRVVRELRKLRQRAGSGVTLDEWCVWFGRQDASVFLTPTRFATAITEFITGKA